MKPPILSDEEIDEVIGKLVGERYLARHATDKEAKDIATAQRDADAAWFRAEIEKVENPHHLYDGIGQDVSVSTSYLMMQKRVVFNECRQKILKTLEGK